MIWLWIAVVIACIAATMTGVQAMRLLRDCEADIRRLNDQIVALQVKQEIADRQLESYKLLLQQARDWIAVNAPNPPGELPVPP